MSRRYGESDWNEEEEFPRGVPYVGNRTGDPDEFVTARAYDSGRRGGVSEGYVLKGGSEYGAEEDDGAGAVYGRKPTDISARDAARLHKDDFFKTWMPTALLTMEILLMVLVWVAIGTAEGDTIRPWRVQLFALNEDKNIHTNIEFLLDTGPLGLTTYGSQNGTGADQYRVNTLLHNLEGVCDNSGSRLCNRVGISWFKTCVLDELRLFTATLGATGTPPDAVATEDQKVTLRRSLWKCASGNPVPYEMHNVTHLDLLVLLVLWYGVGIYTRGVCNYAHTPAATGQAPCGYDGGLAIRRMVVLMHPFTLILSAAAIIYSIVRLKAGGSSLEMFATLSAIGASGSTMFVAVQAWNRAYVPAVTSVHALWNSTAVDSSVTEEYGFNPSWVLLCLVKPIVTVPIFTVIVSAASGMLHFDSMMQIIFLSTSLAILCSALSYYNLYATHRRWLVDLAVGGAAFDPAVEQKGHRPMRVVTLALILTAVIAFTPWPRRNDLDAFWPVEFATLLMFFGLMTMVLPDVIFHRRYMNALMIRERGEFVVRAILTFTVVSFVFRAREA